MVEVMVCGVELVGVGARTVHMVKVLWKRVTGGGFGGIRKAGHFALVFVQFFGRKHFLETNRVVKHGGEFQRVGVGE